ncbi:uncharacterized protein fok [Venturia canescens]|uniref:uncharacterized protein fok n=1 Tax=Venturia canescens TaxID=32260 RepID=UPI001C9BFFA2|nr:uncharacterized protein LOC122410416 [Venturia canescens]
MDLVYMPEVLTFGSFRAPVYRDYEQPWNRDYFNYGKSSLNNCSRQQQAPKTPSQSKHNCQLCKESKRRTLGAYIRGKPRLNSCSEISEEEDENVNNSSESTEKKETDTSKSCKTEK